MNNKTLVALAVILVCALVTSVSAIITSFPPQQTALKPSATPTVLPSSFSTIPLQSSSPQVTAPSIPPSSSSPDSLQTTPVLSQAPSPTSSPPANTPPSALSGPTSEESLPSPKVSETSSAFDANMSNLFSPELSYVYVGPTNSTGAGHDHFGFNITTCPQNYYPAEIILKLVLTGNLGLQSYDAVFEGFLVTLSADTGTTASYVGYFGTNLNPSFSDLPHFPPSYSGARQSVYFTFNLTADRILTLRMSDGGSFGSSPGSLGLWSNGTPNAINATVQRANWVIVNGQTLTRVANPEENAVITKVQLAKSGNGFIFG